MKIVHWLGALLLVLVGAALLWFVLTNQETVAIDLFGWHPEVPIFLLVPGLFLLGFLFGYLTKALLGVLRTRADRDYERRRLAAGGSAAPAPGSGADGEERTEPSPPLP